MKNFIFVVIGAVLVLTLAYCTQQDAKAAPASKSAMTTADQVKHGEYLVTIGGCSDCHSPKVMTPMGPAPDPKRLLSGHPVEEPLPAITEKKMVAPGQWVLFSPGQTATAGPWDTSFAANLTPDDTGIGNWSYGAV